MIVEKMANFFIVDKLANVKNKGSVMDCLVFYRVTRQQSKTLVVFKIPHSEDALVTCQS